MRIRLWRRFLSFILVLGVGFAQHHKWVLGAPNHNVFRGEPTIKTFYFKIKFFDFAIF
jgi:hypothetical protein